MILRPPGAFPVLKRKNSVTPRKTRTPRTFTLPSLDAAPAEKVRHLSESHATHADPTTSGFCPWRIPLGHVRSGGLLIGLTQQVSQHHVCVFKSPLRNEHFVHSVHIRINSPSNHHQQVHPTCPLLDQDICKRCPIQTTLVRHRKFHMVVLDPVVDSKIHPVRPAVTVEVSKTNEANTRLL